MKKHVGSSFVFPPALGERLRAIRRRAGLSIDELAHLMDRRPGYGKHLSCLERGRIAYPSIALVADYLRACRASFRELVPVLDGYTGRPPVRETRARETALAGLGGEQSRVAVRLNVYDKKTEAARKRAGQRPVAPAKRAAALSRQLASARTYRALDRAVADELNRAGSGLSYVARKLALSYGRMVWRAMEKAEEEKGKIADCRMQIAECKVQNGRRGAGAGREAEKGQVADCGLQSADCRLRRVKRGRRRKTRDERLLEVEARMREQAGDIVPLPVLRQVSVLVTRLYDEARGSPSS